MEKLTTDLWTSLSGYYDGFIDLLPRLGLSIVILLIFLSLASGLSKLITRRLGPRMDDPLFVRFISRIVRSSFIIIGLLLVLKIIGLGGVAGSLLAGAGVGAFVIGFAFKDIGENFLAGIVMAFKRPFRINDTVELNGVKGKVVALNLRDTQIKTFDGKDVFIPNGAIVKNPVVNYTLDGFIRTDFVVGIDYDSDIQAAIALISKTLASIEELEKEDRKPFVLIDELAISAVNLRVFYWINTFDPKISGIDLKNIVYTNVLAALVDANIYIPTSIVEVKNYGKNVLKMESSEDKERLSA